MPHSLCDHSCAAGAVLRAAYSPRMFHPPGVADAAATCVALGSQDTKLTVWASHCKRPLLVGSRLFAQSVVDLAWTPEGTTLLACSSDGSVGVMQFEACELGTPLSQARALPGGVPPLWRGACPDKTQHVLRSAPIAWSYGSRGLREAAARAGSGMVQAGHLFCPHSRWRSSHPSMRCKTLAEGGPPGAACRQRWRRT